MNFSGEDRKHGSCKNEWRVGGKLLRASLRCPMPFSLRPFRRLPEERFGSYHAGPFQGQGTVWNFRVPAGFSGGLPCDQRILVPEAEFCWSREQKFVVENVMVEPHSHARL